jgi:hypothetical protein
MDERRRGCVGFFKKKNLGFSSLLPSKTDLGFILEFESWRQIGGFQIQRDAMAGDTFGAGKVGWCCGARAIICPLPFQSSSLASVAYRIKCFFFFFIKDIFFEIVKNKIFESYEYFIFD